MLEGNMGNVRHYLMNNVSYAAMNVEHRMPQKSYDRIMTNTGIELGILASVYNPVTRKHELKVVGPEYWAQQRFHKEPVATGRIT
jgi:hypothetical protein